MILELHSNLSSEQDGDSTKFQKISVECNVQLTPTKEQRKKNTKYFKVVFQFIRNIDRVVL